MVKIDSNVLGQRMMQLREHSKLLLYIYAYLGPYRRAGEKEWCSGECTRLKLKAQSQIRMYVHCKKCIRNWPLPIGAFQETNKQTMIS